MWLNLLLMVNWKQVVYLYIYKCCKYSLYDCLFVLLYKKDAKKPVILMHLFEYLDFKLHYKNVFVNL